jgi:thiol-disulfide isomerase/thioredoxin
MRFFGAHREAGTEILPSEGRLPPFEGATGWLNSDPLAPEGLRGGVVAVQFWTYTCVNWLRTLPYVREWVAKYWDQGLTVIGVHTPEFGFERNIENVISAAREMRVDYPIALDNDYAVWGAFANHFWPALYIADGQGRIRYHHFGEGEYAMSEMVVQQLLGEAGKNVPTPDLRCSALESERRVQEASASKFETHPFMTLRGVTSGGSDASRTLRSSITPTLTSLSKLFGAI